MNVVAHLCWHDPRSSAHVENVTGEEPPAPRRPGCACDPWTTRPIRVRITESIKPRRGVRRKGKK